jgi:hypothetical protein
VATRHKRPFDEQLTTDGTTTNKQQTIGRSSTSDQYGYKTIRQPHSDDVARQRYPPDVPQHLTPAVDAVRSGINHHNKRQWLQGIGLRMAQ